MGHSEQTFCYDVLRSGQQNGRYRLRGSLPPCPNCHGAMMRTAAATDSTITYSWGEPPNNNSITYTPTGVPAGNYRGASARALRDGRDGVGAYSDITLQDNWTPPATGPSGPTQTDPSGFWGVNQPEGSHSTYRQQAALFR